jgi:peptide/nickel transport system substrate-binding protein
MWHNVRFDSLVAASLASEDHDDSQRNAAEAMHILVDEEAGAIPLAALYRIYALRSTVKGFEPHPSRINQSWSAVWIAR